MSAFAWVILSVGGLALVLWIVAELRIEAAAQFHCPHCGEDWNADGVHSRRQSPSAKHLTCPECAAKWEAIHRDLVSRLRVDNDWHRCAWCDGPLWFNSRTGVRCITRPPNAPAEESHGICPECAAREGFDINTKQTPNKKSNE